MTTTPTRGAIESGGTSWSRSPVASFAVRVLAHLLPVVAAWVAIKFTSRWFYAPAGWPGVMLWIGQALVVAVLVARSTDVVSRRLLPLATLLNISLVFPDQAPSKIGVALRAGSIRKLRSRLDQIDAADPDTDPNVAAERALDLVAALSLHDRRTRGHTERVRALADVIAEQLDVDESDRVLLAWGVLLHDVGKLTVPEPVLNKAGTLTDEEWAILRDHPAASRRMLEPLAGWLGPWILAAAEHHERWDGNGYPDGLAQTEISLAGRITAVADAYDVITSKRSYKEPMSTEAARNEIVRCAGTQFDPAVVRAFLNAGLGRRRNVGMFAWLFEAPSIGHVGSTIGGAAASVTAAGAVVVAGLTGSGPPEVPAPSVLAEVTAPTTTSHPRGTGSTSRATTGTTTSPTDGPAPLPTNTVTTTTTSGPLVGPDATTSSTTTTPSSPTPTFGPIATTPPGGVAATTTTRPGSPTATAAPTVSTTNPPTSSPGNTTTTAPPTATTTTSPPATTTTPPRSTTTTTAPEPFLVYLSNPGTGSTNSSPQLPLSSSVVDSGPLPNYDTDRDGDPGLFLAKDGVGLATTDPTKYQDWTLTASTNTSLSGRATLTIDVAAKDLTSGEKIGITAGLYVCSPSCELIGSTSWTNTSQANSYRTATLDLGTVGRVLAPGDTLRLRVVATDSHTDTDLFLAYDTTGHPSRLAID